MDTKTRMVEQLQRSLTFSIVCGLHWPACCNKEVIALPKAYLVRADSYLTLGSTGWGGGSGCHPSIKCFFIFFETIFN